MMLMNYVKAELPPTLSFYCHLIQVLNYFLSDSKGKTTNLSSSLPSNSKSGISRLAENDISLQNLSDQCLLHRCQVFRKADGIQWGNWACFDPQFHWSILLLLLPMAVRSSCFSTLRRFLYLTPAASSSPDLVALGLPSSVEVNLPVRNSPVESPRYL